MIKKMIMKSVYNKGMKLYSDALKKDGLAKMLGLYDALESLVKASNFSCSDKEICDMSYTCHQTMVDTFKEYKAKCGKDNYEYINLVRKIYNVTVNASIKMKNNNFKIERYRDVDFENILTTATRECFSFARHLKANKQYAEAYPYFVISKEFGCEVSDAELNFCKGHSHIKQGKVYLKEKQYKQAYDEFTNAEKCNVPCRKEKDKACSRYNLQLGDECVYQAIKTKEIDSAIRLYNNAILKYSTAKIYDQYNSVYFERITHCNEKINELKKLPRNQSSYSDDDSYESTSSGSDSERNVQGEYLYNKGKEAMENGNLYEAKKFFNESRDTGYISDQAMHNLNQDMSIIEDKIKQEESDRFAEEERRKDEEHRAYYDEMGID